MFPTHSLITAHDQKIDNEQNYNKKTPNDSIKERIETILAIIDMQPHFLRYMQPAQNLEMLINSIVNQIEKSKNKNKTIVVVEFEVKPCGPDANADDVFTDKRIMDALSNYPKVVQVRKKTNSASPAIKEALDGLNIKPEKVTVCGVNTNKCVRETVGSLFSVMPTIKKICVSENACGEAEGMVDAWEEHREGIEAMSRLANVKVKRDPEFEARRKENRVVAKAKLLEELQKMSHVFGNTAAPGPK